MLTRHYIIIFVVMFFIDGMRRAPLILAPSALDLSILLTGLFIDVAIFRKRNPHKIDEWNGCCSFDVFSIGVQVYFKQC